MKSRFKEGDFGGVCFSYRRLARPSSSFFNSHISPTKALKLEIYSAVRTGMFTTNFNEIAVSLGCRKPVLELVN
ncbi:hypothetical protein M513_06579 [Trichuris suis]|uniref:Uncharacterized protein n=1 Tax=Trichuris suis TaxID=68888 RepID=A0A085M5P9_9BILA|nr:hypothetical protein M513_06579 [Trichuris suis]